MGVMELKEINARMQLRSVSYHERLDTDRAWTIENSSFGAINLIVGLNASGKTRTLNVIAALASLLRGGFNQLFESASFSFAFKDGRSSYHYELELENKRVRFESLKINGISVLRREADGSGEIRADQIDQQLRFRIPETDLAVIVKRDTVQHSFLEPLHSWASSVRHYYFGSDLGQRNIFAFQGSDPSNPVDLQQLAQKPLQVVELYWHGYERFSEKLDKLIIKDLRLIGYDCEDVGADHFEGVNVPNILPANIFPVGLFVKERSLPGKTRGVEMSAGMFRAFAIIIHININLLSKVGGCIIIDDIGEGLDFERSQALIKLLIRKCQSSKTQLFMSSNDRFVMNDVSLKYWHIVERKSNVVKMLSYRNSKERFDNFKYLGLNNFDFFATRAYVGSDE